MKIMISRLGLLAGVVLASSSLLAQPRTEPAATDELRAYLELLRSDVNTTKIRTINEVMKLTGPEADTFWPVYRKYEKDLAAVGDRKLALIREFATLHFGGKLDNKQAADLGPWQPAGSRTRRNGSTCGRSITSKSARRCPPSAPRSFCRWNTRWRCS